MPIMTGNPSVFIQANRLDAARELLLQERVYTVRLDGEMDIFQGVS